METLGCQPEKTAGSAVGSEPYVLAGNPLEGNGLLRLLRADTYSALFPLLEDVDLLPQQVLAFQDEIMPYVFFPISGAIALIRRMPSGDQIGVGVLGNEGMLGANMVQTSHPSMPTDCIVSVPGKAKRISTPVLRSILASELPDDASAGHSRGRSLRRMLARYSMTFLDNSLQSMACQSFHSVTERCACWLLMMHDRTNSVDDRAEPSRDFPLTHDFLASMLGVRRAGVTVVAGKFQRAGVIRYRRGKVTVTDRGGLESMACECYRNQSGSGVAHDGTRGSRSSESGLATPLSS